MLLYNRIECEDSNDKRNLKHFLSNFYQDSRIYIVIGHELHLDQENKAMQIEVLHH